MKKAFAGLGLVTVVALAVTLIGSAPAYASSSVSVTVNTISRTDTGTLVYDVNANYSGLMAAGSICSVLPRNCTAYVQVQYVSDGSIHSLGSANLWSGNGTGSTKFASTASQPQISAVRAGITVGSADTSDIFSDWNLVADPWQPPTVGISVNSITRSSAGSLGYDLTASYARLAAYGNICWFDFRSCTAYVQAQYASDGSVHSLDSKNLYSGNGTGTTQFTSTTGMPQISAVRALITIGNANTPNLVSAWVPVSDPWQPQSVGVVVNSITRSAAGSLGVDLTASYARVMATGSVCLSSWSYCTAYFEAQYAGDGTVHSLGSQSIYATTGTGTTQFTTTNGMPQISAVRVRVNGAGGPDVVSDWVSVSDPWQPQSVGVVVNSITRNAAGSLGFDLTASFARVMATGSVCLSSWSYCTASFEAQYAGDGSSHSIGSKSIYATTGTGTTQFTAITAMPQVSAVRVRVNGAGGPDLVSDWVPVSENIQGGHDLDSSLSMALAAIAGMGPTEACITLFPVGTHQQGSSVNDQQLLCLEATNEGKTVAQFLTPYLRTLTPRAITNLLVAAGIAQSASVQAANPGLDIDYDLPLPGGCVWVDLHHATCSTSTGTVQLPPKSAPPRQDPVWESNAKTKAQQNPTAPAPVPVPPPATSPLASASPADIDVIRDETCEAQLARYQDAAGLTDDACDKTAIFFTGNGSPEATQHDREAIAANPAWFKLTYASTDEKAAAGKNRKSSWYGSPGCTERVAGQQCDEYPYFATNEGYPDGNPSLKMITSGDNISQGGSYGAFTQKCFAGVPPTNQVGRQFLVVPLPPGVPTASVCARP